MYLRRRIPAERLRRVRSRARLASTTPSTAKTNRAVIAYGPALPATPWVDLPHGRRRSRRVSLSAEVSLRRLGSFSFELAAGDLSAGGCKVELIEFVEVDSRVVARLPGLEPFGARVAWCDGNQAGIAFERPIHPAVFEQLITRLG